MPLVVKRNEELPSGIKMRESESSYKVRAHNARQCKPTYRDRPVWGRAS
jgi:hypothetical protein